MCVQAEIRTSFAGLYHSMSQREEFRWMMMRIKRMAEPWVSAIRSLAAKQNLTKRRKKKVSSMRGSAPRIYQKIFQNSLELEIFPGVAQPSNGVASLERTQTQSQALIHTSRLSYFSLRKSGATWMIDPALHYVLHAFLRPEEELMVLIQST